MLAKHLFGKISRAGRLTYRDPSWGGGGRLPRRRHMPAMSAWAAGADMPPMIAAGQYLATRSKKRQSARVPRDQTLSAALRPICPLIDPPVLGIVWSTFCAGAGRRAASKRSASRGPRLLIAAWRPSYRYPSAERVQKPLRESPLEGAGFRASPMADHLWSKSAQMAP
jgi:hypothetical protein